MQIEQNIPLAPLTTLRIGGPARFFARATQESDLLAAVRFAGEQHLPLFVLGGGSNTVVPDEGFPGLVLQVALRGEIVSARQQGRVLLDVPAGCDWDEFVDLTCARGYSGVECLAGIPGLVGGTPVQNVGAYGQEVSQTIQSVRVLDLEALRFRALSAAECHFSYRSSFFNTTAKDRFIVTRVSFAFDPQAIPKLAYADLAAYFAGQPQPTPRQIAKAVREIRARKGMYLDPADPSPDHRSAGSFFKNPVVPACALAPIAEFLAIPVDSIPHWPVAAGEIKLAAAWLIEQAGFPRGFTQGAAAISSRHTLALINRTGNATCADLLHLRDTIVDEVRSRFHVALEQEPVFLR